MRVEGYDYRLLLLRTMQAWPRTGCWVCDRLLPALTQERGHHLPPGPMYVPSLEREQEHCKRTSGGTIDAHHLIPKQALKRTFPRGAKLTWQETSTGAGIWLPIEAVDVPWEDTPVLPLGDVLMDVRNTVPVRRFHHDALEAGLLHGRPLDVPRRLLPPAVVEFAGQYGLERLLEAEYGQED